MECAKGSFFDVCRTFQLDCTIDNIDIPVADLGFSEGGFCYSIAREARAKKLRPRPLSVKPRPFSERDFLLYLSIDPFSIKIYG